ncbi:MAG: DUF2993 domain-containing protein [Synergistaceae bacterium]|nr:DUF2993 domain-containing protein [Synergistaceae bacterium]
MRKRTILAVCTALFLFAAEVAWAQAAPQSEAERAALLKAALEKKFSPQSMEVRLEGGPDAKGFVKKATVRAKGAVIDKLRVESLVMEASDLQFNPPEEWEKNLEVKSAGDTRSRGVILETDINAAMKESVKGDKKWKSIRMDLSPTQIKAVGVYETHFLFKLHLVVKLTGKLAASPDGKQIFIRDYKLNVSGLTMPQGLTEDVIEKVQPIIDFRESVFPVSVKKIVMDDTSISFVSDPPPAQ